MLKKGIQVLDSDILILGFTFKENCPDVRNTKVIDIYKALKEYNVNIQVYDPWANPESVTHEYNIQLTGEKLEDLVNSFDAVILAVAHKQFQNMDIRSFLKDSQKGVVYDVKGVLDRNLIDARL